MATDSERQLARLCARTFLRLWAWPNPHVLRTGEARELCDSLVLFGDEVVLFSDKACEVKLSGLSRSTWPRWFRRAVKKSADQLHGAERVLRSGPPPVYQDSTCKRRLPVRLPAPTDTTVYRVAVATAPTQIHSQAAVVRFGQTSIVSWAETPGVVGDVTPERGFVHVMDGPGLEAVLRELTTPTDFLAYLRWREAVFRARRLAYAHTEEDLLASYLGADWSAGVIHTRRDDWRRWCLSAAYRAKRQADEGSYFWDRLIDDFGRRLADGTLVIDAGAGPGLERALRAMAREPRVARRLLSRAIQEKIREPLVSDFATRVVVYPPEAPSTAYAAIVMNGRYSGHSVDARAMRRRTAADYLRTVSVRVPAAESVVGIVFVNTAGVVEPRDLLSLSAGEATKETTGQAERIRASLQLKGSGVLRVETESEYPDQSEP